MRKLNLLGISCVVSSALLVQGCAPVAIFGGATALGMGAAQERGVSGSVSDTYIRTQIIAEWHAHNPHLNEKVELSVHEGRVLLTGSVDKPEEQIDAVRLAWQVKGVKEVIDEMILAKESGLSGYASDSWISTQLRTELIFSDNIQSINYNIKTYNGIVYLIGVAQSPQERDRVIDIARSVSGVKDVVNHVRIKEEAYETVEATKE